MSLCMLKNKNFPKVLYVTLKIRNIYIKAPISVIHPNTYILAKTVNIDSGKFKLFILKLLCNHRILCPTQNILRDIFDSVFPSELFLK